MGLALANAALTAGAKVVFIVGHVSVPIPESSKMTVIHVETTEEMLAAVKKAFLLRML